MALRAFLLEHARSFPAMEHEHCYDDEQQMSICEVHGRSVALVDLESSGKTTSKTAKAPGDDDPDPDINECY